MMYVSACLRPHQELRIQTLGTRMHNYMATMYMFLSVGICASLYLKIESVEKKLYSILNNSVQKVSKLPINVIMTVRHLAIFSKGCIIFCLPLQLQRFSFWRLSFGLFFSFQKTKRNLYTAGTGITTLIAAFIFTVISHLPMVAIKYWIPITTSIQVNILLSGIGKVLFL